MAKYSITVELDFDDEELDDDDIVAERAKLKTYLEDEYLSVFSRLEYDDEATAEITSVTVVDEED